MVTTTTLRGLFSSCGKIRPFWSGPMRKKMSSYPKNVESQKISTEQKPKTRLVSKKKYAHRRKKRAGTDWRQPRPVTSAPPGVLPNSVSGQVCLPKNAWNQKAFRQPTKTSTQYREKSARNDGRSTCACEKGTISEPSGERKFSGEPSAPGERVASPRFSDLRTEFSVEPPALTPFLPRRNPVSSNRKFGVTQKLKRFRKRKIVRPLSF